MTYCPNRIERREYKFLADEETVNRVRSALLPFCSLDKHATSSPDRSYRIASLYFDTPKLSLYQANVHEQVDRFKLRVRHYPESPNGPVFFEVKRRVNDVISKTRGRVSRKEWRDAIKEGFIPDDADKKDRAAIERFLAIVHTYHAAPKALIHYSREPWVSEIDTYARITFDSHIVSQPHPDLDLKYEPKAWFANDSGYYQKNRHSLYVIELKFTSNAPSWMMNIVKKCNLFRSAFSKYGTSILAWKEEPFIMSPRRGFAI